MKIEKQLFGELSQSIYKKNIEDVWKILERYPNKCRKVFLKNLKTLSFQKVNIEELQKISEDIDVNGLYMPMENKIYLNGIENKYEEINHELFHVSSCTGKYWGVIVDVTIGEKIRTIGENLNEGITEYLAYLSANSKNIGESAYQLEVFVIELLISIYGEKILNPYFQNNPLKFYYQFKSGEYSIIYLDILLNQISKWINVRNSFEEYIILRDFVPDELKKYNLYIETFDMKELSRYLKRYEFMINKLYDKIEKEKRLREVFFDRYALQKEESKKMYLNWYYEYSKIQKRMFDRIIKIIIVLARKQDMSDELIKDLLIRSLDNKKSILDVIEYKNKKLVRK